MKIITDSKLFCAIENEEEETLSEICNGMQKKLTNNELNSRIQQITEKKKVQKVKLSASEKVELDRLIRIKASRNYRQN